MSSTGVKVVPATSLQRERVSWTQVTDSDGTTFLKLNGGYKIGLSGSTTVGGLEQGNYKLYFVVKPENPKDDLWQKYKVNFLLDLGTTKTATEGVELGPGNKDGTGCFKVPSNGLDFTCDKNKHRFVSFSMSEGEIGTWKEGLLVKGVCLEPHPNK